MTVTSSSPTAAAPVAPTSTTMVVAAGVDTSDRADDLVLRRQLDAARVSRATRPARPAAVRSTLTQAARPAAPAARQHQRAISTAARPAPAPPQHQHTERKAPRRVTAPTRPIALPAAGRARTVIAFALAQRGRRYRWATAGPDTFDCSGLVMAAYARVGMKLPHQTGGIIDRGRPVSRSGLQPGDVVFPQRGHVAIYIGNGLMVHAPHSGTDVQVGPVYGFWAARRLL